MCHQTTFFSLSVLYFSFTTAVVPLLITFSSSLILAADLQTAQHTLAFMWCLGGVMYVNLIRL